MPTKGERREKKKRKLLYGMVPTRPMGCPKKSGRSKKTSRRRLNLWKLEKRGNSGARINTTTRAQAMSHWNDARRPCLGDGSKTALITHKELNAGPSMNLKIAQSTMELQDDKEEDQDLMLPCDCNGHALSVRSFRAPETVAAVGSPEFGRIERPSPMDQYSSPDSKSVQRKIPRVVR